jgi:hypothetical protein
MPAQTARAGAPGTFTGANGVVRTIRADGSLTGQGSNQRGTAAGGSLQVMSGAPVGANGAPLVRSAPPPAAPATTGTADPQVAAAQARNLATNARASQVTARTFGAPDVAELQRRLQHNLRGKNTASARRGLIEANNLALGAIAGGAATAQQAAEGAIAHGNQAQSAQALDAQRGSNALAERNLTIEGNLAAQQQQADLQAGAPQPFVDAQGNAFVRQGTALSPVTGPDGKQARAPMQAEGQITPAIAFKAMNDELAALNDPLSGQMTAEERTAREQSIQARYAPFMGEQGTPQGGAAAPKPAAPSIDQFLARAKAQGSKMTDAQLRAAYAEQFGSR